MPVTIFGLPVHPLIVHATVVVVPTAALAVLLAAVWPRFRRWARWGPLALSVVGLGLVPLSTASGENLESQVGGNALIERHSQLADGLLPWMIGLAVVAAVLLFAHWRSDTEGPGSADPRRPRWLPVVAAMLGIVAAVGTSVQVVLIGHSGAEAAWSDVAGQAAGGNGNGG
ncbi:MAG: DUF2231 domain-containing protein [Nocardioidaceae bacterium]